MRAQLSVVWSSDNMTDQSRATEARRLPRQVLQAYCKSCAGVLQLRDQRSGAGTGRRTQLVREELLEDFPIGLRVAL